MDARVCTPFHAPHVEAGPPEHHQHREEGEGMGPAYAGCPANIERRRQRDEEAGGEKRDAIPDLLLEHPYATLTTYV